MSEKLTDNELLDRYLSGAITAPQEAELERRALSDPILANALAGLGAFPEEDHAARVANMTKGVRAKVKEARVRPLGRYAAVAAVALLLVAAVFLLPQFANEGATELAMETKSAPQEENKSSPSLSPAPAPGAASAAAPDTATEFSEVAVPSARNAPTAGPPVSDQSVRSSPVPADPAPANSAPDDPDSPALPEVAEQADAAVEELPSPDPVSLDREAGEVIRRPDCCSISH